jgi:hypothetical protein
MDKNVIVEEEGECTKLVVEKVARGSTGMRTRQEHVCVSRNAAHVLDVIGLENPEPVHSASHVGTFPRTRVCS